MVLAPAGRHRRSAGMSGRAKVVAIVVAAGVGAAVLVAACVFLAIWMYRRRASVIARLRSLESSTATQQANGSACLDSSVSVSVVSESVDWGHNPLPAGKLVAFWGWRGAKNGRDQPLSISEIPKYHYKYGNYSSIAILVLARSGSAEGYQQFHHDSGTRL